ncbi:MAG: glycoside hydrolase family 3 C-terminal domain-containing protein [Phototrophicaceae bacterium]
MPSKIDQLISQMTLEEKARLCTGGNPWKTVGIERLGLNPMIVADGPHGLRRSVDLDSMITESYPATCFPVAATVSSSWDVDLLHEMGQALADESIALGVDILLGPGMNIKRSPLCGRNFEYFSEDPLLSGEMAASLINGIQSKGVGTSLKHYAVNNQETRRFTVDALVDERTLQEIYLAGFEIAVKKAQPWTLMCAYNSVNGDFCAENHYLLTEILRDDWGFEGFVMSDWGAVHERVDAIKAGLELEMPGPSPQRTQAVIDAVNAGELDEMLLDQAVERLLRIILRAQETSKGDGEINIEEHHALARRIASESIILLKNKDNTLPLSGDEQLAVIGQSAKTAIFQGGGSSHIKPTKVDAPLDFLQEHAEIQYVVGDASPTLNQDDINEASSLAKNADVAVLFIALPASIESEGYDRPHLELTEQQTALIKAVSVISQKTVVVLNNGSAIDMSAWIDDVDAVIEAWLPGQAGAGAIIDILYGDVNPSGKLSETFPLRLEDTPSYLNFPGERDEVRYGEGIFVGYRGYEALNQAVLFPFGFGLSYTEFSYSNLSISKSNFSVDDTIEISVDVTNTGARTGKEIIQVYVHDVSAKLPRPYKELKGFTKIALEANETKTVTFSLDSRAFSYYDPAYGQWIAEAGDFKILVGSSSADIRLQETITLEKGTVIPSILNLQSTLSDWLEDPKGMALIQPMVSGMFAEGDSEALGIDMFAFFKSLPLITLLGFMGEGDTPTDVIVRGMLEQVQE